MRLEAEVPAGARPQLPIVRKGDQSMHQHKMRPMFRRGISALVVPALLLLAAPAVATAGAESHTINLHGLIDTISSKGNAAAAAPGATETDSGVLTGTISGKSTRVALYQYATWGSGLTLTSKGVAFDPDGSIRFEHSDKFVGATRGTLSWSGTVTATGGTGVYKHAHGSLSTKITTLTSDADAVTISMVGTLKY